MSRRYRLYFDESGDHAYRQLDELAKRYLGLTGIIIESTYYRTQFRPAFEGLKRKHFAADLRDPNDPDDQTILHRSDLINRRGAFGRLRELTRRLAFEADFLFLLEQQQYLVITVVLDKLAHVRRYGELAFHPYHYCLAMLLERYCGYLHFMRSTGDVLGESRGGVEDRLLREAYQEVLTNGTTQRAAAFFSGVLPSADIRLKPKAANLAGLQFADLLAFPSKQDVLAEAKLVTRPQDVFGCKIAAAISAKYLRDVYRDRVRGHGKVLLGGK